MTPFYDPQAEAAVEELKEVVLEIRKFRAAQGIPPNQWLWGRFVNGPPGTPLELEPHIRHMCKLERTRGGKDWQ